MAYKFVSPSGAIQIFGTIVVPSVSSGITVPDTVVGQQTSAVKSSIDGALFSGQLTGTYIDDGNGTNTAITRYPATAAFAAQLAAQGVGAALTSLLGVEVSNTITQAPSASFKNKVINGNFDYWQRSTNSPAATGSRFVCDRWNNNAIGASTMAISLQSFALGQTAVPNNPTYFHRVAVVAGASAADGAVTYQGLEDVTKYSGKTVTVSFWAKADAARNMAVELQQYFGTGGSPTGAVSDGGRTFALTTSWQKFSFTTTIASVAGTTLGTNNNHCVYFAFWWDAGSNFNSRTGNLGHQSGTFDLAQVQLEEGSVATPYETRPQETELALCQRYCLKVWPNSAFGIIGSGVYGNSTVANIIVPTPVTMKSTQVTITKNGVMAVLSNAGASNTVSAVAQGGIGPGCVIISATTAALTTGNTAQLYCSNDATAYLLMETEL